MIRSFQFRCRPTKAQKRALDEFTFKANQVYNAALEQRKTAYRRWQIHHHKNPEWEAPKKRVNKFNKKVPVIRPKHLPGLFDQDKEIKDIRKEFPEFGEMPFAIFRNKLRQLSVAFDEFPRRLNETLEMRKRDEARRALNGLEPKKRKSRKDGMPPGFPRFKSFRRTRQTLQLNSDRFQWRKREGKFAHITFKGLPGKMRFKIHNPEFAREDVKILGALLTRDHKGWLVTFQCELSDVQMQAVADIIGIDVGIEKFLATSEHEIIPNPRFLEKELPALRRAQRAVSRKVETRKKRGSKAASGNEKRARKIAARLHNRVQNLRKNFHHETAALLVGKGNAIAVEDLNIKGLSRSKLARQVNDVAWGHFLNRLVHKAESAGLRVEKVDPKYTSQACSGCGDIVPKPLRERTHKCPECGLVLDRDVNAAINIKNKAVASLEGAKLDSGPVCP